MNPPPTVRQACGGGAEEGGDAMYSQLNWSSLQPHLHHVSRAQERINDSTPPYYAFRGSTQSTLPSPLLWNEGLTVNLQHHRLHLNHYMDLRG